MGQPARVLDAADVRRLLKQLHNHRYPDRDTAILLLSFKAGLRACEIAGLDWAMVLTLRGKVDDHIRVASTISKNSSSRRIPINPALKDSLRRLHQLQGRITDGPVIRSERGTHMRASSIVNWFAQLYKTHGLQGCSSHSGRRTFITRSARLLTRTGGSLRDIQELAGHRSLTTTERYIEGDRDAQRRLVRFV